MIEKVWKIYFSPSGSTKTVVEKISENFCKSEDAHLLDLLKNPLINELEFNSQDLIIIGLPVFVGRLPEFCTKQLELLKGNKTPVIATVNYGNREYEDALLELTDLLLKNGFLLVGAAAFVSQHSIFPKVAMNRPDQEDFLKIEDFSKKCMDNLSQLEQNKVFKIKGNYPYRELITAPLTPSGNESCIDCKKCVDICPVKAIDTLTPIETNGELCIRCTACISVCPTKTRKFYDAQYEASYKRFVEAYSERKEPEIYV